MQAHDTYGGEADLDSTSNPDRRVVITLASTTLLAWLGEFVHNAIELPSLTLISPENSIPGVVAALLFGAYFFLPHKRASAAALLVLGLVNFVGGGLSVLPLGLFPLCQGRP